MESNTTTTPITTTPGRWHNQHTTQVQWRPRSFFRSTQCLTVAVHVRSAGRMGTSGVRQNLVLTRSGAEGTCSTGCVCAPSVGAAFGENASLGEQAKKNKAPHTTVPRHTDPVESCHLTLNPQLANVVGKQGDIPVE